MREIVVLSGKGGTGKTSVCASFAHLARNKVVCDLDVDAPDLHILLDPAPRRVEAFRSGNEAVIDEASRRRCGRCFELCRFGAVIRAGDEFYLFFLGKRFQIHQYFIDEGINGNGFIPSYRLKFTHIEQCLDHFAEPAVLFRNHLYRL
mgnify:CR=1 FL=1